MRDLQSMRRAFGDNPVNFRTGVMPTFRINASVSNSALWISAVPSVNVVLTSSKESNNSALSVVSNVKQLYAGVTPQCVLPLVHVCANVTPQCVLRQSRVRAGSTAHARTVTWCNQA